jgi:hypothetical protein
MFAKESPDATRNRKSVTRMRAELAQYGNWNWSDIRQYSKKIPDFVNPVTWKLLQCGMCTI